MIYVTKQLKMPDTYAKNITHYSKVLQFNYYVQKMYHSLMSQVICESPPSLSFSVDTQRLMPVHISVSSYSRILYER
jgi:hypothetical protein